jgi:hypothetical protein
MDGDLIWESARPTVGGMVAGPDGMGAVHTRIADIRARIVNVGPPLVGGVTGGVSGGIAGGIVSGTAGAVTDASSAFAQLLDSAQSNQLNAYGVTPGAVPANGDMRAPAARQQFATDLLARLGMPQTAENVRALVAWQQAEGTRAAFNPLATTQGSPGASDFNSVGVKNYTSYAQGLDATVTTLRNGRYGEILAALLDGRSASRLASAVEGSPWGTGDGVRRVLAAGSG